MVDVKTRDGLLKKFFGLKIVVGVKKAGATASKVTQVAKEVSVNKVNRTEVTASELSKMVVGAL